jgi:hypothetical protein
MSGLATGGVENSYIEKFKNTILRRSITSRERNAVQLSRRTIAPKFSTRLGGVGVFTRPSTIGDIAICTAANSPAKTRAAMDRRACFPIGA